MGTRLVPPARTAAAVVVPLGGHQALAVTEPFSVNVRDSHSGSDTRDHRSHDGHEHSEVAFHCSLQMSGLLLILCLLIITTQGRMVRACPPLGLSAVWPEAGDTALVSEMPAVAGQRGSRLGCPQRCVRPLSGDPRPPAR